MGPVDDHDKEVQEADERMAEFIRHVLAGYGLSDPLDEARARAFVVATRDGHPDDEPKPDD